MKDTTIAPYIIRHKREIKENFEALVKGRVVRSKSAIFSLPEFDEWEDFVAIDLKKTQKGVVKGENLASTLNSTVHELRSKVVIFSLVSIPIEEASALFHTIASSKTEVVIRTSDCLAISKELFVLARGFDELLEKDVDILDDLTLRAELIGAELASENWKKELASDWAVRNVQKSKLFVNQGSILFD